MVYTFTSKLMKITHATRHVHNRYLIAKMMINSIQDHTFQNNWSSSNRLLLTAHQSHKSEVREMVEMSCNHAKNMIDGENLRRTRIYSLISSECDSTAVIHKETTDEESSCEPVRFYFVQRTENATILVH